MELWDVLGPQMKQIFKIFLSRKKLGCFFNQRMCKIMFQKQRTYDNQTSFHFLKFQYFPSHYKEALILCFKLC